MATVVPAHEAHAYRYAADLPKDVWRALFQNEAAANIILPFLQKALHFSRRGVSEQLWIVVYDHTKNVEFVLSCVEGPLGKYPIFIVACKSSARLVNEEERGRDIADSLTPLVLCLLEHVPPQRVFSVFAIARVARRFAEIFEAHASPGIKALVTPYYDATFTFCTRATLKKPSDAVSSFPGSEDVTIALLRADMSHLNEIKAMCKDFSETSWPFILDDDRAELETKMLITNQQVWVHTIQKAGQDPEVACLVATTRESDNVMAVTKVFTARKWRGLGCAVRLLHRVCHDILQKKDQVILYVGNSPELAPARRVYDKIGFQGLTAPHGQQVPGVEKWVEIGFTGTDLGHW